MTTGQEFVNAALSFVGQPYSTAPGRGDPNSGHKDCSGLVVAAYKKATGVDLPANVSVTLYQLCRDQGQLLSKVEADSVAGALYFCPEDPTQGWGAGGHVGISGGTGEDVEATPWFAGGVQVLPNNAQRWGSHAGLLPGLDYGSGVVGGALTGSTADGVLTVGSQGSAVLNVQEWLINMGFVVDGGADGDYGEATASAVSAYQTRYGLGVDGIWGPQCQAKADELSAPKPSPTPVPPPKTEPQPAPPPPVVPVVVKPKRKRHKSFWQLLIDYLLHHHRS